MPLLGTVEVHQGARHDGSPADGQVDRGAVPIFRPALFSGAAPNRRRQADADRPPQHGARLGLGTQRRFVVRAFAHLHWFRPPAHPLGDPRRHPRGVPHPGMRAHLLATTACDPPSSSREACCRILRSGSCSRRDAITIITHEDPIGRVPSNYMIHADLSERQEGWREQLWTRRLTEDIFEVACLPFFTYGICYRDVVTIDTNHLVASVVQKSGDRTLRVALVAEHKDRDQLHEHLYEVLEAALQHEWLRVGRPAARHRSRCPHEGAESTSPSRFPSLGARLLTRTLIPLGVLTDRFRMS
ncbi:DUF4265 domain-containing protein [Streptomyces sp. Tu6071]|uniref:DUF4265 domain-containing protein n=1 Tax=Streptomyces sp. Tu6071 TaxID=355249 RepID=UPI003B635E4C